MNVVVIKAWPIHASLLHIRIIGIERSIHQKRYVPLREAYPDKGRYNEVFSGKLRARQAEVMLPHSLEGVR